MDDWEKVRDAIIFWHQGDSIANWGGSTNSGAELSLAQQGTILGYLALLYAASPRAHSMLDHQVDGGGTIRIYQTNFGIPGWSPPPLGVGLVGFNLDTMGHE